MHPPTFRATVAALAAGQLICWAALFYAFSSFVLPMQQSLRWTQPQTMGAFTFGLAAWGATTFTAGMAIDRGHGRALMSFGAAAAGAGFVGWSFVQTLPMLYAVFALLGASMAATLYEPAFMVLTKRFPEHYRQAITALTLVGGFASTLSFPACVGLIEALGWRPALQVIGAVLLLGVAPLHAWALRGEAIAPAPPRAHDAADDATLHEALRHRGFWLLTACFTFYSLAAAALWAHIMPAFASKGIAQTEALGVVVWFGPAQVAGRFAFLGFGPHVSSRTLGLLVLAAMPVSLAIFALAHSHAALLVFALLFGIANGLVTIVRGAVVPEFFGREHVGKISGAMSAITLLARAAAPLAAAWALVALGGYPALLLGLAALGVFALVSFALAR